MRDFICINPNVFEKKYPSTRAGGKPGISSLRLYKFETLSGAGTVAEISYTKTPKPGEWWVSDSGLVAHVVGLTLDGEPAWQQKNSRQIWLDEIGFFLACFHHEPRCDSFDWVEPEPEPEQAEWSDMAAIQNMDLRRSEMTSGGRISWAENQAIGQVIAIAKRAIQPVEKWPKYYRGDNWCSMDAYVRFDDEYHEAIWVAADGTERVFHGERFHTIPERIEENSWREVTEAEALARVKPAAIDPGDGWEILPAETMREINDELTDDGGANWQKTNSSGTPIPHDSPYVYRRRIQPVHTTIDVNPGDGYRWLRPEEFVEGTDEVFRPDLNPMWIPPLTRAGYMCCDDDYPVRRRIEPVESPDDWVEITDPGHVIRSRCRRKDLPNVRRIDTEGRDVTEEHGLHDESDRIVKRIPVDLIAMRDNRVIWRPHGQTLLKDEQFILHDADGFYVEGER